MIENLFKLHDGKLELVIWLLLYVFSQFFSFCLVVILLLFLELLFEFLLAFEELLKEFFSNQAKLLKGNLL